MARLARVIAVGAIIRPWSSPLIRLLQGRDTSIWLFAIYTRKESFMMTHYLKLFVCLLAILVLSSASAQQSFNNDSVIKMFKMGFQEEMIVGQINRMPGTYDTSVAGLTALKNAGVGDKAVAAMVNKAAAPAPPAGPTQTLHTSKAAPAELKQIAIPPFPHPPILQGKAASSQQNLNRTIPSGYTQKTERLYVTDDPIFEHTGIARDSSATHTQKGADPRTMEIQADIFQSCPGVIVTNNPQAANYVLILRRKGGQRASMFAFGGLTGLALSAGMKVDAASLFDRNGDMVCAVKERSVENAVKKLCPYIIEPVVIRR
jgi:hypothetical protein